jgi:tetratricopeptide (TPR) repeat protein
MYGAIGMGSRWKTELAKILAVLWILGSPVAAMGDGNLDAGRRAYEASDYGKAVEILQDAATKNPSDGEAYLLLAKSYFELRQYDAAIAAAEKAIGVTPDNSVYHEWLGRSYGEKASKTSWLSALSFAKKAQREFETAIRLDKRNFGASQALIEFDCAAPGIAGGGEDKAQPQIEQLAAMDASEGHYAAGNCRRQKKDYAAAEAEFDKALVDAKAPDLIFDIGDYAVKRKEPDRVTAVVSAGQRAAPRDVRIKFYRAAALILENEQPQEAEKLLREYLKTAPTRTAYPHPAVVHDWLGRLFENQDDREAARREYETSLQLEPRNKEAEEALKRLRKS